jgi:hypothetical protein
MQPVERRKQLELGGRNEYSFPKRGTRVKGDLTRIRRGLYIVGDYEPSTDAWPAALSAHLLQSGPGAVVGLESAARLHQLDGFRETNKVSTLTHNAHNARSTNVARTRSLTDDDVVVIDGYPTTSLGRTLLDLGRVASSLELELAVESALRGPDPGKPAKWNTALLVELWRRIQPVRPHTGAAALRRILRQRPDGCRPTGSYAETEFVHAVRPFGLGGIGRQCDVRFFNPDGGLERELYTDFTAMLRLFVIEINGKGSRNGATMTRADVARMNLLARVFRVHVIAASDAGTRRTASEVRSLLLAQPEVTFPYATRTHTLALTKTGIDVYQHR